MAVELKTDYQLEVERGIQDFAHAVLQDDFYDEGLEGVRIWEEFLVNWLNGMCIEDCEFELNLLFETFQPYFPTYAPIYRGMQLTKNETLRPRAFASFSLVEEVAKHFAGYSETYGYNERKDATNYLLTVNPTRALDLSAMLMVIKEKTFNEDMLIAIDERLWETEIISPLSQEMLDKVSIHTFTKSECKPKSFVLSGEPMVLINGIVTKGGIL